MMVSGNIKLTFARNPNKGNYIYLLHIVLFVAGHNLTHISLQIKSSLIVFYIHSQRITWTTKAFADTQDRTRVEFSSNDAIGGSPCLPSNSPQHISWCEETLPRHIDNARHLPKSAAPQNTCCKTPSRHTWTLQDERQPQLLPFLRWWIWDKD